MNGLPHILGNSKVEVKLENVYGKSRHREFTICRQLGMYICDFIIAKGALSFGNITSFEDYTQIGNDVFMGTSMYFYQEKPKDCGPY